MLSCVLFFNATMRQPDDTLKCCRFATKKKNFSIFTEIDNKMEKFQIL